MTRAFQRELARDIPGCFAVAHRGARAFAPENTLPAFARAASLGCAMVELDVHSTRDGQLVVHHDDDLLRCTNAARVFPDRSSYALADFSLAELQRLDAGRWFANELRRSPTARQAFLQSMTDGERQVFIPAHSESRAVHLPRLADVLDLARREGLRVNIELKPSLRQDPLLADRTLALVEAAGLRDRVLVSSFDLAQLVRTRELSIDIAIALLTDASRPDAIELLDALDADALNPNCADPGCLDDLRAVRETGRLVFPWTCNDTAAMARLAAAGATGVITDYPNRFPGFTAR